MLEEVCKVVPSDTLEKDIMPIIMKLFLDIEINVKVEAIKLVFKVTDYLLVSTK